MATIAAQSGADGLTSSRYQALLVGLLGVNLGVVFLDRTAFGLLAPMIQPEFVITDIWGDPIPGFDESHSVKPDHPSGSPVYPQRFNY